MEQFWRLGVRDSGGSVPSPAVGDITRLEEQVNKRLVDIHARRLVELGVDDSGLFDHYAKLVAGGAVLGATDLEAFKLVVEGLPPFGEYVVLRAGLGELALLLKEAGLRVVACEMNAKRFEALVAGCAGADEGPEDDRLHFVEAFVPDAVRDRPALGIATDFIYSLDLESDTAFRRGLSQFDALLINPRLFLHVRDSLSEQRAVVDFIRSLGFADVVEYADAGLVFAARASRGAVEDAAVPSARASDAIFDDLLDRVMALVPATAPENPKTTWVERRIVEFDMTSAFGRGG